MLKLGGPDQNLMSCLYMHIPYNGIISFFLNTVIIPQHHDDVKKKISLIHVMDRICKYSILLHILKCD